MDDNHQQAADDAAGFDLVAEVTRARRQPQRMISLERLPDGLVTMSEITGGIPHRLPVCVHPVEARELATALVACWSPSTPVALVKLAMALLAAESNPAAGRASGCVQ